MNSIETLMSAITNLLKTIERSSRKGDVVVLFLFGQQAVWFAYVGYTCQVEWNAGGHFIWMVLALAAYVGLILDLIVVAGVLWVLRR